MNVLLFDTETTGIPKHPASKPGVQPRIIEFGAVVASPEGEILDHFNVIVNPQIKLEAIITKITGLTDEDLQDKPLWSDPDLQRRIRGMFERCGAVVAHNLPFDTNMVELERARFGLDPWPWPALRVCTVQESFERWGRRPKLLEWYAAVMGKPLEQKHRALDDVEAMLEVCLADGVFDDISAAAC